MSTETFAKSVAWSPSSLKSTGVKTGVAVEKGFPAVANLSSLAEQLEKLEDQHSGATNARMGDARLAVVDALEHFRASGFRLAERLSAYKQFFVTERAWMAVAQLIANSMGRNERTIRRMVGNFQLASKVPSAAIEAMERQGLDPAARKNAPIITKLLTMPSEMVASDPDAAVSTALELVKSERESPIDKRRPQLTKEEKQRHTVRSKIRSALADVSPDHKLAVLLAAVEEEMLAEWGQTEPIIVTITPRRSDSANDDGPEHPLES